MLNPHSLVEETRFLNNMFSSGYQAYVFEASTKINGDYEIA